MVLHGHLWFEQQTWQLNRHCLGYSNNPTDQRWLWLRTIRRDNRVIIVSTGMMLGVRASDVADMARPSPALTCITMVQVSVQLASRLKQALKTASFVFKP